MPFVAPDASSAAASAARRPVVQLEDGRVVLVGVAVAQERQLRGLLVERERLVVAEAREQRLRHAVRHRASTNAPSFSGVFASDEVPYASQLPSFAQTYSTTSAIVVCRARRQVADDELRARVLLLLLRLLRGARLGLGLGLGFGLGVRLLVGLLLRRLEEVRDEPARLLGHLEALHAIGGEDLAGREVEHAEAALRLLLGLLLFLLRLVHVGLDRRDGEHDEPVVGRDDGVAAARLARLGAGLQVPDDQFAVAVLRRERVDEPGAVARDLRALDGLPPVVGVVGDRAASRASVPTAPPTRRADTPPGQGPGDERMRMDTPPPGRLTGGRVGGLYAGGGDQGLGTGR